MPWFVYPQPPAALVAAQNQFGLALVQRVAREAGAANVFLSPLGVTAALALAMAGAAGPTRATLAETLFGTPDAPDAAEAALADQLQTLTQAVEEQAVVRIASSLWVNHAFALAPTFIERVRTRYQAEAASLDFADPAAAPTINAWAGQQTQGRVSDIVSTKELAGPPPPAVVLLNAVYFQARWESPFSAAATAPGWFSRADGTGLRVPFMRQVSQQIGYLAGDGWQAVRLPYEGYPRSTAMLVFVPDAPDGLPALLATLAMLGASHWAAWQAAFWHSAESVEVDLTLPRFRLTWRADLAPALRHLGLAAAFAEGADFSPLGFRDEAGGGLLGAVVHSTFLAVDEEGTEAAAVTAVLMMAGGAAEPASKRRVEVRADSPFFCAIVDNHTQALLFAGTVYEPA